MDKYASALLELAKARRSLAEINKAIGYALDCSRQNAERSWPKDGWGISKPPTEWEDGMKNGWLALAYKIEREHYGSGVYDVYFANHDDDVRGYLAEHCAHALRAHDLIQERKAVKKALGIAKRRVTFLSNRLLEQGE